MFEKNPFPSSDLLEYLFQSTFVTSHFVCTLVHELLRNISRRLPSVKLCNDRERIRFDQLFALRICNLIVRTLCCEVQDNYIGKHRTESGPIFDGRFKQRCI